MSAAEFQKRIADLTFSVREHIEELQNEQDDSLANYDAWKDEGQGLEGDELEDHENEVPDVTDNSEKIARIETAIGHLEAAADELDGAIDED